MRLRISDSGDTIIEVLISISIIGSVLGAAYTLTHKSVTYELRSQEHNQALQLLQTQIEAIRVAGPAANQPGFFCMSPSGSPTSYAAVALPTTACDFGAAGNPNNSTDPVYHLSDTWNSANKTFTITGSWGAIGGGTDSASLNYRID